jgi:septal ring factor EnvC (AmiA/AmiB activator)
MTRKPTQRITQKQQQEQQEKDKLETELKEEKEKVAKLQGELAKSMYFCIIIGLS